MEKVVSVRQLSGFYDRFNQWNNYVKQNRLRIEGYDDNGRPIVSNTMFGMFRFILKDEKGNLRTLDKLSEVAI